MPLVSLEHVSIAYGHLPLLDDASLQIEPRERVCVIGRNGTGKSTLLQIISGDQLPDAGNVWRPPGLRIARLVQDVPLSADRPVFDVVAEGLGDLGDLAAAYHHAAVEVAASGTDVSLEKLGRLQHALEQQDGWRLEQRVELVLERLDLPADAIVDTLSGGWRRRTLLARALVAQPDVLLLDEPTNHLDIEAMTWLETFLADYPGTVVFVTHDRVFLQRVATRIVELDRGRLTSWPGDYATFLRKKEEWLANEAVQNQKFDKRLAEEEAWLRQGVKARRTRNEGRVRALIAMRKERAARRAGAGTVRLPLEMTDRSGELVFEAERVTKSFGASPIVRDLSLRVMRGDRVGLIGPNGSGKTTLLRLIMGELEPDAGEVRQGSNVQIAYYDQQREQLDPDRTVFDTVGDGRDTVTVNGRTQHVHGYLRNFLFGPERAASPVRALSGGERNRLLLARLFTRPANVLVLDEPTNDLDIETLELLEALLVEWPGTLLLVSHDRAFIDHVVTSTLVFEGAGRVQEYVGGYADWLRQRPAAEPEPAPGTVQPRSGSVSPAVAGTRKLSYREQQELQQLPERIEELEGEQQRLTTAVGSADFYKESGETIRQTLARLEALQGEVLDAYARWNELDSRTKR
ncbi:MAG TPA: ATP-binding cassette domain-containing protein [Vicinamibacterales bacterium]|jgi:ATP-binding cassette subfamily F protein uup|nr:ATP-binding cassette domain-containing protein [Vicinamibacterales bacterium]